MTTEYIKIKFTPRQKAYQLYNYIRGELHSGLNLNIAASAYNKSMKAAKFKPRTKETVTFQKFASDFYTEHKKCVST